MVDVKKFPGCGGCNDAARLEQNDSRREEQGFADIVGDEDDGFAEAASERAELALQFGASDGIESAERFVHQQNRRVRGERARDPDALPLAAGKLVRAARGEFAGIESDEGQELLDASGDASGIPFFECRHQGNVFSDGEMGKQTSFLNNVSNPAAEADGVPLRSGAALDEDLPICRQQQTINQF